MNSNFANNLKRIRKENNLSQEQLADKLNVSRQSVSKWESSQAYPEMDKVLQLCKMFNVNIDELLNQDIKEVKENKEGKNKINKYLDDFLSYITKTINMFSSMKFKEKIKCLFEQVVIALILIMIFCIIYEISELIVFNIFSILPNNIYHFLSRTFEAIYILACFVFSVIVLSYIFKTRYLDYYTIINSNEVSDNNDINDNNDSIDNNTTKNNYINTKEKIIIRDPKHSEYKFINGLFKCLLFIIKCFLMCIYLFSACCLIILVSLLFISLYYIIKIKLFIGISLILIALIIITIMLMTKLFSFIYNKKINLKISFIIFLISIGILGIGTGITFLQYNNINIEERDYSNNTSIEKTINYNDLLNIESDNNLYIFEIDDSLTDRFNITVNYNNDINKINFTDNKYYFYINIIYLNDNFSKEYKDFINNLKENRIVIKENINPEITIKTSKENIYKYFKKFDADPEENKFNDKYYLYNY